MSWIKNGPKKNRADFSSISTFLPKPTCLLLDLSILFTVVTHIVQKRTIPENYPSLGNGGGLGCGVVLGPLGEATSSKSSLVGVACWKGEMRAC